MIISNNQREQWQSLRNYGDAKTIAEKLNVHPITIRRALNSGNMSETIFLEIQKFYDERRSRCGFKSTD